MTLDSESPYKHTCPSREHGTKVIVHGDNPFMFTKDDHFMIDTLDIGAEGKDGLIPPPVEKKCFKVMSPPKQFSNLEDPVSKKISAAEHMDNPYFAPCSAFAMVVKEDFYTEKIVSKVGPPGLTDSNEGCPCCIPKDISIDTEVQSLDRSMVENEGMGRMRSSMSDQSLHNGHNDTTSKIAGPIGADHLKYTVYDSALSTVNKDQAAPASVVRDKLDGDGSFLCSFDNGGLDTDPSVKVDASAKVIEVRAGHVSVSDDTYREASLVTSFDDDSKPYKTYSVASTIPAEVTESLLETASDVHSNFDGMSASAPSVECGEKEDAIGSVSSGVSAEIIEDRLSPSQETATDSSVDSSSLDFIDDQKQSIDGQTYKDISNKSNSTPTALLPFSEVSGSNASKEISADCKVPGGIITFNLDREVASTSGRDENKETSKSEVVKTGHGTEEAMIEGPTASAKCSFRHLMQADSEPDFLSGPIVHSGHIPYSGSISLRSDSSTTSARSFAFPILQSEWNSSPVKMAKADRRHLRKHRGWRMGILCCRF